MNEFRLKLPLLDNIDILISNRDIFEFALRQLANYITYSSISTVESKRTIACDIVCRDILLISKAREQFSRNFQLARNISFNNSRLYFKNEYFLTADSLTINTRKPIKNLLFKKKPDTKKYATCHSLFYEMILFPIFSMYCIIDGYYLLHGSLLDVNNRYILLLGLDGVGKSTVAEALSSFSIARVLADNFVLFNGKSAIPLNLAMRLEPEKETNLRVLYRDKNLSEVLPDTIVHAPVIPETAYLMDISPEFNIQKITLNPVALTMYLNNAPEIGAANNFLTPFIIFHSYVDWKLKDLYMISNPRGQLADVVKGILNAD